MLYVKFLTQAFDLLNVKLISTIDGDFSRYVESVGDASP